MKSDNILYLHNGFFKYYTSSTISMILYYYLNICVKYAKNTTKKLGQHIYCTKVEIGKNVCGTKKA